jgi:hypothetical protein
MKDKPFQLGFLVEQWMVALCNVEYQILKELFFIRVCSFYGIPLLKKLTMESMVGFFIFLAIW